MTIECSLRLYLSAASPSSARAVVNARSFCEKYLPGQYELEILNIAENVEMAIHDQVIATPTLVRVKPGPVRRFIGDLADSERLFEGLNVSRAMRARAES